MYNTWLLVLVIAVFLSSKKKKVKYNKVTGMFIYLSYVCVGGGSSTVPVPHSTIVWYGMGPEYWCRTACIIPVLRYIIMIINLEV